VTKSQVNRLGDKLRRPGTVDEALLALLQQFRGWFDRPMAKAQGILADSLGLETTARLKTVNTIVEKLRREKTRLAEMQDIAGLRVVQDMALGDQDALARQIVSLFPGREGCGPTGKANSRLPSGARHRDSRWISGGDTSPRQNAGPMGPRLWRS